MKYNAIIVLGSGLTSKLRLTKITKSIINVAIKLLKNNFADKIVLSGDKSGFIRREESITEAEAMFRYAIKNGLDSKKLIKEEMSKDTIGNAFFCKKYIIKPNKWYKLIVITPFFTYRRIKFIFKKIFCKNFKIKFIKIDIKLDKKKEKEILLYEEFKDFVARLFFSDIISGDDETIEKRIYNFHLFYR